MPSDSHHHHHHRHRQHQHRHHHHHQHTANDPRGDASVPSSSAVAATETARPRDQVKRRRRPTISNTPPSTLTSTTAAAANLETNELPAQHPNNILIEDPRRAYLTAVLAACTQSELRFLLHAIPPLLTSATESASLQTLPPAPPTDPFTRLPPELALHILSLTYCARTVTRATRVSRRWYRLARDESVWRVMCAVYGFGGFEGARGVWEVREGKKRERERLRASREVEKERKVEEEIDDEEEEDGEKLYAKIKAEEDEKKGKKRPHHTEHVSAYTYRRHFKCTYILRSNWERGGHILKTHALPILTPSPTPSPSLGPSSSSHAHTHAHAHLPPSSDSGTVTALALDRDWIVVGFANALVRVYSASKGVLCRTLVGHKAGVWCVCLVGAGGVGDGEGDGDGTRNGDGEKEVREEEAHARHHSVPTRRRRSSVSVSVSKHSKPKKEHTHAHVHGHGHHLKDSASTASASTSLSTSASTSTLGLSKVSKLTLFDGDADPKGKGKSKDNSKGVDRSKSKSRSAHEFRLYLTSNSDAAAEEGEREGGDRKSKGKGKLKEQEHAKDSTSSLDRTTARSKTKVSTRDSESDSAYRSETRARARTQPRLHSSGGTSGTGVISPAMQRALGLTDVDGSSSESGSSSSSGEEEEEEDDDTEGEITRDEEEEEEAMASAPLLRHERRGQAEGEGEGEDEVYPTSAPPWTSSKHPSRHKRRHRERHDHDRNHRHRRSRRASTYALHADPDHSQQNWRDFGATGAPDTSDTMGTGTGATRGWGQPHALVVSGGCDKVVKVWDVVSGQCIYTLHGHRSTIRAMRMVDGTPLAITASRDGTMRVWDVRRGCAVRVLEGHEDSVRCLEVAIDFVMADDGDDGGVDGENERGDGGGGEKKKVRVRAVSGSYDRTLRLWDISTGKCIHVLRGHLHQVYCVAFDGVRIASGGLDTTIRIWNAETGQCTALLQGHTALVCELRLVSSPPPPPSLPRKQAHSQPLLISASAAGALIAFDLGTLRARYTLPGAHRGSVTALQVVEVHPPWMPASSSVSDSDLELGGLDSSLAAPSATAPIEIEQEQGQIDDHNPSHNSLHPYLLTAGTDGLAQLFCLQTGEFIRVLSGDGAPGGGSGGRSASGIGSHLSTGGNGSNGDNGGRGNRGAAQNDTVWKAGAGGGTGAETCAIMCRRGTKTVVEIWGMGVKAERVARTGRG
ncbi:WD repeat-containing protein pop1 [Psilocybe cubensis]|uniref:F-box domain-containing protein n=2 Tax=Psilocybe cubensis TaxID=181762 RepID=A0A8H8CHW9_PSICU|nr:WD repeat-containing protein pop1 [Psilocybe cubensis]KAH9479097.1 WD repeat-containing protein pop1 [Psilocybe cubensis]